MHRFSGSGRVCPDQGPVDEPVETVDSPVLLALRGAGAVCQHEPMDDDAIPQADIATVPPNFDESVILLDVREDDEWQRGHAPGAVHIPMGQIPDRIGEIDSTAALYVVCQGGGRSQRVSQYLAQNGYAPVNVSGGMLAWAGAGRPVVTDDGGVGAI
jgi:rhodanese-related sulfurtransferase